MKADWEGNSSFVKEMSLQREKIQELKTLSKPWSVLARSWQENGYTEEEVNY
jgi:hypothetical protein